MLIIEQINPHIMLNQMIIKTPWPMSNRDYIIYAIEWHMSENR